MIQTNGKIVTLAESIAESTSACLVTMVQGNLLALTLGHFLIAAQTGVTAGAVATIVVLATRPGMRWILSAVLGAATAVVDFFVHPGQFGPAAAEALITGLAAGLLSYLAGTAIHFLGAERKRQEGNYRTAQRVTLAELPGLRMRRLKLSAGQCVPWHYHNEVKDTFFCLQGPMSVRTREPAAEFVLQAGDIAEVPAGRPHFVEGVDQRPCEFVVMQGVGAYDYMPLAD